MGCICSKPNVEGTEEDNKTTTNNNNPARIKPDESRVNSLSASKRHQQQAVSFSEGSGRPPVSRGPSSVYSVSGSLTSGSSLPPSKISSQVTSDSLSRPPLKVGSQKQYSGPLTGSSRPPSKVSSQVNSESLLSRPPSKGESLTSKGKENGDVGGEMMTIVVDRSSRNGQHHRRATVDLGVKVGGQRVARIVSLPRGPKGENQAAAAPTGWPSWLTSVAGEAIQGWVPRKSESFEKIEKIGQGTYSSVYKARDLESGKIVAMKKVRFVNMDPESVRFMAREIIILRKLDHPNVMKLEGLVISRMPGSLYLVFEYMEHDLAGLLATPGNKFTESQIKCYVQQMLRGLEHCHSNGILHRDIKGSNLLINNNGILKIGDFGLATLFTPNQNQPLTSRVVTLWYRAPELLLGSTNYGIAVDMWSVGCIIAELFAGKPIMPGRTEVEQMHKIFKLCGSPSEDYWKRAKLPHGTSFKPHQPYKRRVSETFKEFPSSTLSLIESLLAVEPEKRGTSAAALESEFFTTKPLPCEPSSLPKYPPSKELDAKYRDEEGRRQKANQDHIKGRKQQQDNVTAGSRNAKQIATDDNTNKATTGLKNTNYDVNGNVTSLTIDTRTSNANNGSTSMVHPSAWTTTNKRVTKDDESGANTIVNLTSSKMQMQRDVVVDSSNVYGLPKKNRIHYSGPLVPLGGNLEDMLKEHERQIQQAVRKSKGRNGVKGDQAQSLQFHRQDLW